MMLIDGTNEVFMIDRDNSVFHVSNLEFPFRKDLRMHLSNTLLDGVSHIFIFFKKKSNIAIFLPCANKCIFLIIKQEI